MRRTLGWPFLLVAWVLLPTTLFSAVQMVSPGAASDLRQLQGHWEGQGPGGEVSVTISGNSLDFRARADFWYETDFTIPEDTDSQQLHATIIKDSSAKQADIGRVVVALFKVEGTTLTLGVVDDFDEPPVGSVDGDWDWVTDLYYFERAPNPD